MRRRISMGSSIESRGRLVHQPLDGNCNDRARNTAVRRHGAGVGEDGTRGAGIFTNIVGARHLRHGHERLHPAGRRIAGISTDIGENVGGKRDQSRIGIKAAFESDMLIATVKTCDQILAPVLQPGDRGPQPAREPGDDDELRAKRHLLPEAAADIRRDHAQIGFRHSDQLGNNGAHHVRRLGGAGERHTPAAAIPCRMRRTRLERQGVLAAGADLDPDAPMRARHGRIDSCGFEPRIDHDIVRRLRVNTRGARSHGVPRAGDRRHRLDLDVDQIGQILGLLLGRREHRRDRFSDKAHHISCQHRLTDRDVIELMQKRPNGLDLRKLSGGKDSGAVGP